MDQSKEEILQKILSSKKYRSIYPQTIERVIDELTPRYPAKQLEQQIRKKLHQMYGAYFTKLNYTKLLKKVEEQKKQGAPTKEILLPILKLHSSTKERIPHLNSFYKDIFEITGQPNSITDYGCGLNPLTYPWMDTNAQYTGYDIDKDLNEFINSVSEIADLRTKVTVKQGDVLDSEYPKSDIALLLKILPLLEKQKKGCSTDILKAIPSNYIIVSFPTKSISGQNKGMEKFYTKSFTEMIKDEKWPVEKIRFENEVVFVVKK